MLQLVVPSATFHASYLSYIAELGDEERYPFTLDFDHSDFAAMEWFLDNGTVAFNEAPADTIYYNRMSASSHTRGHRFAPELTRAVLTRMESFGRTVVNNSQVLAFEVCKLSRYAALQRAGVAASGMGSLAEYLIELARD